MSKKNWQQLTSQELSAIEDYLSAAYLGPVDFSRRIIASGTWECLRKSITLKSGDVFTLRGETVYHQAKFATAVSLNVVANSNGLYVVRETNDGVTVHLELMRVTDFASAPVAA